MELRYYINTTQISEPIGFDDFKTILKRTEQHGVSAESSVGELEFDGVGFGIIQTAYNTDIDIELIFKAEIKCDDNDVFEELYSGILDLSTYEETYNDYCGCKVKVGEIGVKTTFNNRVDTVVDIARLTSLDGDTLTAYSNIGKEITIPAKGLLYQTKASVFEDTLLAGTYSGGSDVNRAARVVFGFDDYILNEIGNIINYFKVIATDGLEPTDTQIITNEQCSYLNYSEISNQDFKINISAKITLTTNTAFSTFALFLVLKLKNGSSILLDSTTASNLIVSGSNRIANIDFNYNSLITTYNLSDVYGISLSCGLYGASGARTSPVNIVIDKNNYYFNVSQLDIASDTTAKISLIHETLSRLTEIYSGVTVKSDFYGRSDSEINPLSNGVGDGALKAILTGLQLRKSLNADGTVPRIETSFKDMFTALNAVDNIGWGFTTGSGIDYIRVESWKWFYNDIVIITIDSPANKKRMMRNDVFTRLKIGYNKYGGQDDINSIDTFHTNRDYTSGIKAIDKVNSQISKFIADPYAIEFTRRKALDKDTKDWKYDEDLFLLCLKRDNSFNFTVEQGVDGSVDTIISPETMTNFRISPKRNSMRWADRLFEFNSVITDYKFTAGVGNVTAKGEPTVEAGYDYINDIGAGAVITENSDIDYVEPHLKPELITFEYPLTKSEYDDIKAEPYGQIVVDGEACYIQEIVREVITGMCEFKLIPKN